MQEQKESIVVSQLNLYSLGGLLAEYPQLKAIEAEQFGVAGELVPLGFDDGQVYQAIVDHPALISLNFQCLPSHSASAQASKRIVEVIQNLLQLKSQFRQCRSWLDCAAYDRVHELLLGTAALLRQLQLQSQLVPMGDNVLPQLREEQQLLIKVLSVAKLAADVHVVPAKLRAVMRGLCEAAQDYPKCYNLLAETLLRMRVETMPFVGSPFEKYSLMAFCIDQAPTALQDTQLLRRACANMVAYTLDPHRPYALMSCGGEDEGVVRLSQAGLACALIQHARHASRDEALQLDEISSERLEALHQQFPNVNTQTVLHAQVALWQRVQAWMHQQANVERTDCDSSATIRR